MQFAFPARPLDPVSVDTALRLIDPDAKVALDAARGRLEVISTATAAQVGDALAAIGCPVTLLEKEVHISGGSTCCGHCA